MKKINYMLLLKYDRSSIQKKRKVCVQTNYDDIVRYNPCIVNSVKEPNRRHLFWQNYPISKIDCIEVICELMTPSPIIVFAKRVVLKIKSLMKI